MPRASATLLQFSANTRWVELHTESQLPIELMNFQEKKIHRFWCTYFMFHLMKTQNYMVKIVVFSNA